MNEMNPSSNGFDQQTLDRLVDGELQEDQRRAVLAQMEGQPELWRRCALAFLEAQSWRQELSTLRSERVGMAAHTILSRPEDAAAAAPSRASHRWTTALMVAASFLLAFVLGLASRPLWDGAAHVPVAGSPDGDDRPIESPETMIPSRPGEQAIADAPGERNEYTPLLDDVDPSVETLDGWSMPVTYVSSLDEARRELDTPVFSSSQLHQLQRMGYALRQQQRFVPLDLEEGQTVYVPIDDVQLHYVGRPRIQ